MFDVDAAAEPVVDAAAAVSDGSARRERRRGGDWRGIGIRVGGKLPLVELLRRSK